MLQTSLALVDRDLNVPDKWTYVWGREDYTVQKFYMYFFRDVVPISCLPLIWKTKCVMKHKVFAWLLIMDRLNTQTCWSEEIVQYPIISVWCAIWLEKPETTYSLGVNSARNAGISCVFSGMNIFS